MVEAGPLFVQESLALPSGGGVARKSARSDGHAWWQEEVECPCHGGGVCCGEDDEDADGEARHDDGGEEDGDTPVEECCCGRTRCSLFLFGAEIGDSCFQEGKWNESGYQWERGRTLLCCCRLVGSRCKMQTVGGFVRGRWESVTLVRVVR